MAPATHGGRSMRFVKKVNERGVLTLPNDVREALGVEEGDIVEFEVLRVVKKRPDLTSDETVPTPKSLGGLA